MGSIVALAVGLGLGIPAVQILRERDYHVHNAVVVSPDGRERFVSATLVGEPFWPRYVLYLRGRPWKKQPVCDVGADDTRAACELAHPGMVERQPDGTIVGIGLSPAERAEYERLRKIDPLAQAYGPDRRPIP